MNKLQLPVLLVIFSCMGLSLPAQDLFKGYEALTTHPRQYTVPKTEARIIPDGKLDEASWKKARWSENFVDIEGAKKTVPAYRTRFKMLWDARFLYVGVEMEEPHIWTTLMKRDAIIYHDNDIEIFIDPDGDTRNYYEIEINAFNTVLDLFMPKPYRNGGKAMIPWDAEGFKSAVCLDGSINDPGDTDRKWVVEMAIPFTAFNKDESLIIPQPGNTWRINFSRVQWKTMPEKGQYLKVTDSTTRKTLPEQNWVWSPQGVINMHYPERWGYVTFSGDPAGDQSSGTMFGKSENQKRLLWLIYYKQKDYQRKNKKYAASLQDLNLPASVKINSRDHAIKLGTDVKSFTAEIKASGSQEIFSINQDGEIFIKSN